MYYDHNHYYVPMAAIQKNYWQEVSVVELNSKVLVCICDYELNKITVYI